MPPTPVWQVLHFCPKAACEGETGPLANGSGLTTQCATSQINPSAGMAIDSQKRQRRMGNGRAKYSMSIRLARFLVVRTRRSINQLVLQYRKATTAWMAAS